jgi:ribosomal protein S18 acetylase RimI-like enzyme
MRPGSDIRMARADGPQALGLAVELGRVYAAAYLGTPQEGDPFYSGEQFAARLAGYASSEGFVLATARDAGAALLGYAFGYALPPGARWWDGLLDPVPEGFITETGTRTFALCELHVRAEDRGRGLATRLHRELLAGTPCERATVLVRPENPARGIYERWGYRSAGRLKPYPQSPTYLALVRPRIDGEC